MCADRLSKEVREIVVHFFSTTSRIDDSDLKAEGKNKWVSLNPKQNNIENEYAMLCEGTLRR